MILDKCGDGPEFVIDFIIYVISTCIIENPKWHLPFSVVEALAKCRWNTKLQLVHLFNQMPEWHGRWLESRQE